MLNMFALCGQFEIFLIKLVKTKLSYSIVRVLYAILALDAKLCSCYSRTLREVTWLIRGVLTKFHQCFGYIVQL